MGQMVHRHGEFEALRRPARCPGAAVLQAGVQHQRVDRRSLQQQRFCQVLHAVQIGQIADREGDRFRQRRCQGLCPALVAAGQGEAVASLGQPLGGRQADA
jgi:hypothetical protein